LQRLKKSVLNLKLPLTTTYMNFSSNMNNQIQQEATEIMLVLEDTVEYLCREHMLSGEKVWVMVGALADAKLKEFPEEDSH